MGLSSAVLLVIVAFAFLYEMTRWVIVGLAVVEVVVAPQILKRTAIQ